MLDLAQADAEIVAVHDPDRDRATAFAEPRGAVVADTEEEVVEAADAVYVCAWTSEHPRLVSLAAERGRAVFCEKPLATTLAAATGMVETVRRAGVVNQVGLVMRDYPAFQLLRALVHRPENGRVMSVVFRDDQYLPVQGIYGSDWRADRHRAGAGTLLEHSIHDLDILEWLCGEVVSVSGRTAAFHPHDGIEDVAVATLAFASGALATLTSVWHDVLARPSLRRVEVFCERGWYALEGDVFGPVRWTLDGEEGCVAGEELVERLHAEGVPTRNPDGAFVEAVARGTAASPGLADALRAHLLADAVYRSAASGGVAVATAEDDGAP
jgi:predicted dehydrogenase